LRLSSKELFGLPATFIAFMAVYVVLLSRPSSGVVSGSDAACLLGEEPGKDPALVR
jgi:hypothetical protein